MRLFFQNTFPSPEPILGRVFRGEGGVSSGRKSAVKFCRVNSEFSSDEQKTFSWCFRRCRKMGQFAELCCHEMPAIGAVSYQALQNAKYDPLVAFDVYEFYRPEQVRGVMKPGLLRQELFQLLPRDGCR